MATTTKITAPELNVSVSDMTIIGKKEVQLITRDARYSGITQNPTGRRTSHYSEKYKKLKNNYMRRLTNRTGGKGTLLAGVEGSVKSNQTSFKNYTLTAGMWNRLKSRSPYNVKINECTVGFDEADEGKLRGASDHGDNLVGLNNKNINIIKDMIIKKYNKELDKWSKKDINLIIG